MLAPAVRQENVIVIAESRELAVRFTENFDELWDTGAVERSGFVAPRPVPDDAWALATRRAALLRRHLERIPTRPRAYAAAEGPRYSFRNAIRHPDKPMRRIDEPTRRREVALGLLVDCSGSMAWVVAV